MIEYIEGVLKEKYTSSWVIEVYGIGWLVRIPPVYNLFDEPVLEDNIRMYLYESTSLAGNKISSNLYGFLNKSEREFFVEALKMPKMGASSFISCLIRPVDEIAQAILNGNLPYLKSLPGIGAGKAAGLIDTLQAYLRKNGIWTIASSNRMDTGTALDRTGDSIESDLLDVLLNMQYSRTEALQRIARVRMEYPEEKETDILLRYIFAFK